MPRRAHTDPVLALKQQLAAAVVDIAEPWTQWEIATVLGVDQPRMSDLARGRVHRFSIDRLVRMLDRLHHDVRADVTHRPGKGIFAGGKGPAAKA